MPPTIGNKDGFAGILGKFITGKVFVITVAGRGTTKARGGGLAFDPR